MWKPVFIAQAYDLLYENARHSIISWCDDFLTYIRSDIKKDSSKVGYWDGEMTSEIPNELMHVVVIHKHSSYMKTLILWKHKILFLFGSMCLFMCVYIRMYMCAAICDIWKWNPEEKL